jgi:CRP-like cAMP-binding protein
VELGTVFGPGALVGEIGVFAPDGCRTGTVVCEVDAEIGSIDNDTVLRYAQNPTFGLYLTRLVVQRMLAGERRLAQREAPTALAYNHDDPLTRLAPWSSSPVRFAQVQLKNSAP